MKFNESDLYEKLFDPSPKKKVDESLFQFSLQVNPIDPSDKQKKKKKKKEEDVHQYIRLAEKSNDKVATSAKKWKEEQTMTPQEIRQKKQLAKIHQKFETKKAASSQSTSKKKYLPNIIDPFGKNEKKGDKAPPAPTSTLPKKEAQKTMRKEQEKDPGKISKVEAKQNKIREKQRQKEKEKVKEKTIIKQERQDKPQEKREEKRQEKKEVKKQSKPNKKKQSSSSSGSESESEQDWRKQLRQITKYNPSDRKFKIRDLQDIKESGVDRIFGQDKVSYRMGMMQQEQDLRRQLEMKEKKHKHKHKHRHH